MHVCVIAGPALLADHGLLEEIVAAECAALAVPGRLVAAGDPGELRAALGEAGTDENCAVIMASGDTDLTRQLIADHPESAARAVWFDPAVTGPIDVEAPVAYLYGRGLWGLPWAIRHAVHRARFPVRRIRYGPHADQWGDLRLPAVVRDGGWPVAVLLHGGYWRSIWGADLMEAIAIDLAGRGFATWNLEYRRPDRHGWAATTDDVAAGLALLPEVAAGIRPRPAAVRQGRAAVRQGPAAARQGRAAVRQGAPARDTAATPDSGARLDLDRVAVIGHSAGGQLALRVAADSGRVAVAVAVSLAGVVDLAEGVRRGLGNGAVAAAIGGPPAQNPDAYAAADPMARLPIGVPLLIVQGRHDDVDLVDINRRFVRAARAAGDDVVLLERPGDHFAVIDPESDLWRAMMADLAALVASERTTRTPPARRTRLA